MFLGVNHEGECAHCQFRGSESGGQLGPVGVSEHGLWDHEIALKIRHQLDCSGDDQGAPGRPVLKVIDRAPDLERVPQHLPDCLGIEENEGLITFAKFLSDSRLAAAERSVEPDNHVQTL